MLKEDNSLLLKKILEVVLEVNIQEIVVENVERNTGNINIRRKNLDILLHTDKGKIDIEMNACHKDYLHSRNMAYLCDTYSHYTLVGEEYTEDVQIIQINFTYGLGLKDREIVRRYFIQDDKHQKFVKNFLIIEYNMDRIMKLWYSKDEKEIDKYKYLIMLDLNLEELKILSKRDRLVKKYMMDVEIVNCNPAFRMYMSEEEDRRKCYNSEISIATKKGLERGLKKGAKKNAIETIKRMLADNVPIENIAKYTNLSIEEVDSLKE